MQAVKVTHSLLNLILKIPGIKVNRNDFFQRTFANEDSERLLDEGPLRYFGRAELDRRAALLIKNATWRSSTISFATGMPGGLAIAATLPADTTQFYAVALRLAQELGYLYGREELWDASTEKGRETLLLYLGAMLGVSGTGAMLRVLSSKLSTRVLECIPQKALEQTLYYPLIKKVAAFFGKKISKRTFARGVSKAVPILGGVASGGLTYATMKTMARRLQKELALGLNDTPATLERDLNQLKRLIPPT
ncbi:hypothetical protein [Sporolactobacillus terrae]|uniref:Bacteriochlorophyll 4-vinyl reductase n=1 Tax=Sporolactobacillus terrae TaxID=269673 RepID=A0ABX5Q5N2_9BACL|nr:hypothetical protein [Sporolactobacillus terrae]QAA21950.1 hypothetical protein C0674_04575 [Sporolactobacillus terrae]QAA24923.1 hypothetical protein C0679_04550 [Sporolactobacillus terrae]